MTVNEINESSVKAVLLKQGFYASTTVGTSMQPLLKTGRDMVIIQKNTAELKKYDIALYFVGGRHILHRVIKVTEAEYLIRGDNTFIMEHIPKDKVIGVASVINRNGKRIEPKDNGYRLYVRFWNFIYPLRYVWYHIKCIACKMLRRS